jgi:hypothetical protein
MTRLPIKMNRAAQTANKAKMEAFGILADTLCSVTVVIQEVQKVIVTDT